VSGEKAAFSIDLRLMQFQGTRAFQSISVLRSGDTDHPPPHDYLDDLQPFFYVICWICFGYEAPGKKVIPQPEVLTNWEDLSCTRAAGLKVDFLITQNRFPIPPPYFGPVFQFLLEKLRLFFVTRYLAALSHPGTERKTLEELIPQAKLDYAEVLQYVDEAIEALQKDCASPGEDAFWGLPSDPAPVTTTVKGPSPKSEEGVVLSGPARRQSSLKKAEEPSICTTHVVYALGKFWCGHHLDKYGHCGQSVQILIYLSVSCQRNMLFNIERLRR
jgi:hypothetical protein